MLRLIARSPVALILAALAWALAASAAAQKPPAPVESPARLSLDREALEADATQEAAGSPPVAPVSDPSVPSAPSVPSVPAATPPSPPPEAAEVPDLTEEIAALTFLPDPTQRQANATAFIADVQGDMPEQKEAIAAALSGIQALPNIARGFEPAISLKLTHVADGFTAFLLTAWPVVHGQPAPTDPQSLSAIRTDLEEALAQRAPLVAAADLAKQNLTEGLYLRAGLIAALLPEARTNAALMDKLKAMIQVTSGQVQMDVSELILGADGLSVVDTQAKSDPAI